MARSQNCPQCSCTDIFRVHRKPQEYVLFGWRAFCCLACRQRFLLFEPDKLWHWRTSS